jgi:putative transposase
MAEEWISVEELRAAGWPDWKIQREVAAATVKSRPTKKRSPNGRPIKQFFLSSLPSEMQVEIRRNRAAVPQWNRSATSQSTTQLVPFRRGPTATDAPRIVLPDPEAHAQAEHREHVLKPLLDYLRWKTRAEKCAWCAQNGLIVGNAEDLVKQIAAKENCDRSTIWQWLKNYRDGGFAALADRARADKGVSRWFERHSQARVFAAYLYLVERMSISFVCEQLKYEAERLGLVNDLPSRETVRIFLSQNISPAMKTYAREGERAYRERMSPYLKRGYVDVYANQVWVGDHMIHDIEISNDVFDDVPFGTPGRLRLSAFIDYRSRKAWATWAWEGSSRSIAATLLRGILEVGPPEDIYVDNGKDYKKVAKGAQRSSETFLDESPLAPAEWWQNEYDAIERTGILARLGIKVTHCIPRHPQSKHVERFFRTLHERFDAAHSTYTSGSPATRPAATEAAMMYHRWLLKRGRVAESKHPLASQVILACLGWIEEYNNTPHSGEGMDGRTPNEVFESERNPNQKPCPEPEQLALMMMDRTQRRVRECAVTIAKRRYMPRAEDRIAWAAMHEANETEVLVAYNATDPEFVAVLDQDGRFMAWLEAEEMFSFAPWSETTQHQIGQSMEIRRGLEKATKATLRGIAVTARANGARSAQELLYERLELPVAVGQVVTQPKMQARPKDRPAPPMTAAQVARTLLEE